MYHERVCACSLLVLAKQTYTCTCTRTCHTHVHVLGHVSLVRDRHEQTDQSLGGGRNFGYMRKYIQSCIYTQIHTNIIQCICVKGLFILMHSAYAGCKQSTFGEEIYL